MEYVLFDEIPGNQGRIGLITLNRPQALNALDHAMLVSIRAHLIQWKIDDTIKAVVIRAVPGRAFSAGGDIRSAYERKLKNDPTLFNFFSDEYDTNQIIFHYPKPYIAFLDGITMGGGAGISIHASHRVATQQLVFAMPETTIGFYPDVGASYFLSRLPDGIGIYLGLTGEKINAEDCLALGLVDVMVSQTAMDTLFEVLVDSPLPDKQAVTTIIKPFQESVLSSALLTYRTRIQTCFNQQSVEDILQALDIQSDEWAIKQSTLLQKKSPTSLKVTLEALSRGRLLDFDACMRMENVITHRMVEESDFFEGIRALLIDKDQHPHWKPKALADVTVENVRSYFLTG